MIVTTLASSDHITPKIKTSLAEWLDMIPGEIRVAKLIATVETQMVVATKEGLVTERRGIFGRRRWGFTMVMVCCDDRVDFDSTSLPSPSIDAAMERIERGPAAIGN
jgi:hypothetical protein